MSAPELPPHGIEVVLVHPEIPQNTGSIARLCAATGTRLHLVRPLGFSLEDRYLKRAGLDYWPHVDLAVHESWHDLTAALHLPMVFFSARAEPSFLAAPLGGEGPLAVVFGCETSGLPPEIAAAHRDALYRIPIFSPHVRSLNLANAVSIVLYDALRRRGRLG